MAPKSKSPAAVLETLQDTLSVIFDQAQVSLANHRKNCVALYKLHAQIGAITQPVKNGTAVKLVGERAFGDAFVDMVARVLLVKKGPATADRVVKFVGAYVKFMNEKVSSERAKLAPVASSSASRISDDDDDTMASRFVSRLLKWLLRGFLAKNKNVRYRAIFIVSEMISHLGELDEDMYDILRDSLIGRLCDKETIIRAYAVVALSKLVGSEDPNDAEQGEKTIQEVLLEVMCCDPAAEVRRAALINVPLTPITLDSILSRTRDTDHIARRMIYSAVLQPKLGHPRHLTIAQREQVVKDGLGDREPGVRLATGKMVASWFDNVLAEASNPEGEIWTGDDGGIMQGFVAFLSLFDVVGPGEAVAVDAMLSIFVTRPELLDVFVFSDEFWKKLSPESAVLARVFVEHCLAIESETHLEAASLPVVTAFAFHIQEGYNALLEVLQEGESARLLNDGDEDDEESERREEELAKREIVLGELLRMALKLDYMDEIGRRKVFSVVKDMLAHPELPPGLIERCLDVLKEIMPSERELIRVVVEVVIELRDDDDENPEDEGEGIANDESHSDIASFKGGRSSRRAKERHQMSDEERLQTDMTDMRCLTLCIGMLERVHGTFEDNSTLEGILADLIIPAVKRKELAMREKGLVSLGLCCLIAKKMALSSFQLFLSQVQSAPEDLKVQVLQIIFDLLIMYDQEFFGRSDDIANRIIEFLLHTLEAEESPAVQAVICIGISKLLLPGIVTDPRLLTSLAVIYVSPTTVHNLELRQCLSYFFPVYCYSSPASQSRMQSIFIPALDFVTRIHEDLDEDQEMISPYQFGLLIIDWTNPQKAMDVAPPGSAVENVHVDLAVDILANLYDSDRSDEDQKVLCQLLSHLHIMPGLDDRSLLKLNILLTHHEEQCPFDNPALDKIFDRFKSRFSKLFAKELRRLDPQHFVDDEFRKLYEFIGVDFPAEGRDARDRNYFDGGENDRPQANGSIGHDPTPTPADAYHSKRGESHIEPVSSVDEDGESSPTPPPRHATLKQTRKAQNRATQRAPRPPALPIPDGTSEEDEAEETMTPAQVTPKQKGAKRLRTPSSRSQDSPVHHKRNRVNGPPTPRRTSESAPEDSDTQSDEGSIPTRSQPQKQRATRISGTPSERGVTPTSGSGENEAEVSGEDSEEEDTDNNDEEGTQ